MTAFDLFGPDEIEAINASIAAELSAYEQELRTQVTMEEAGCIVGLFAGPTEFRSHRRCRKRIARECSKLRCLCERRFIARLRDEVRLAVLWV